MRKNLERLIQDLEEDQMGIETVQNNLKSLDYVLNKIVYLKSYAVNMMFKDAVVLKKEPLNEVTLQKGMFALEDLMKSAITKILEEGALDSNLIHKIV